MVSLDELFILTKKEKKKEEIFEIYSTSNGVLCKYVIHQIVICNPHTSVDVLYFFARRGIILYQDFNSFPQHAS